MLKGSKELPTILTISGASIWILLAPNKIRGLFGVFRLLMMPCCGYILWINKSVKNAKLRWSCDSFCFLNLKKNILYLLFSGCTSFVCTTAIDACALTASDWSKFWSTSSFCLIHFCKKQQRWILYRTFFHHTKSFTFCQKKL